MATAAEHPLARYRQKRDFNRTTEPHGEGATARGGHTFVVQKHAAGRLHYDFRLEMNGVLVSWALPKGPSFDPADKRVAVHVEDHPLSYRSFEGVIPPKQYGAGSVIVWDHGTWEPHGDPAESLAAGKVLFKLHGQKLAGTWELVRIAKPGDKQDLWILFKKRDAFARPKGEYNVLRALPDSVISRPLAGVASCKRSEPRATSGATTSDTMAGAVKGLLPDRLKPQLATLSAGIPAFGRWIYEIKLDGYRLMARIEGDRVKLITRGGHDWAAKMPELVTAIKKLGLRSAWLDGEIVVMDANGLPSFNGLQKAFDGKSRTQAIEYFLFDVPYLDGYDLRGVELTDRRALLSDLVELKAVDRIRFSADFQGEPGAILQSACQMGLEGVIAKREDSLYASTRSDAWLKLKCKLRQEFVVCGYTGRSDGSAEIGSLLLGVYSDTGRLESVGSVGTGWSAAEAAELKNKLARSEVDKSPFEAGPAKPGRWSRRAAGSERWVQPRLVAEVQYGDMTPDGHIRHATYVALRSDKAPKDIRRETMQAQTGVPLQRVDRASATGVKITHGERVIDPSTGLTKLDVVRYYESVAEAMLPHLVGRPCSLVRGPTGVDGELFFQKHSERTAIQGLRDMDAALWPGHDALLEVGSAQALAGAAQMNVIEFHTWNSAEKRIDTPDRLILDLDPGDGTPWAHVQEAAMLVQAFLRELGLECWLKTSGGKGLHIVVPITPKLGYETVKSFSQAVVQHLARVIPSRFVAKSGSANRIGKIFVDYLRNGHGATTAAAFSARARPGMGVSMPVAWDGLQILKGGNHWTIATAREHLSFQRVDPWAGYWTKRQTLAPAMKLLGFKATRRA